MAWTLAGIAAASAVAACASATQAEGGPLDTGGTSSGNSSSANTSTSSGSGTDQDATTPEDSGSYGTPEDTGSPPVEDSGSPPDDAPSTVPGPTCAPNQTCVDGIPSGWTGYVQLLLQTGQATVACAGAYPTAQPQIGGQTNPDGGPATCGACTCAVPDAGLGCTVIVEGDNTGCIALGTPPETTVPVGVCTMVMTDFGTGANGKVSTPTGSGTCAPQGGAVITAPPPPTSTTAVACASGDAGAPADAGSSVTCSSGQGCAAFPAGADGGMPSGVCMYQAGIQTCPPSGTTLFTNTFVVGGLDDSRTCGCACGTGTCPADGYVEGFTAAGCGNAPTYTFDAGAACNANISSSNRPTYVDYHLSRSGSLGECEVEDAGPTGSVGIDGGSATTFCCIP